MVTFVNAMVRMFQTGTMDAAEEAAKAASLYCNSFGVDGESVVEELMRSVNKRALWQWAIAWIRTLAQQQKDHRFDQRNEYSVKVGAILAQLYTSESVCESKAIQVFCQRLARQHRTIQQSFSSIIFWIIRKMNEEINLEDDVLCLDTTGLYGRSGKTEERLQDLKRNYMRCPLV